MSLNSIHKEIQKREAEEIRKRFNKTEEIKIEVSLAHLDFIKESVLTPFKAAVEAEKDSDKKPATIAFQEISSLSEEALRKWMIEAVITSYVNQYTAQKVVTIIDGQEKKQESKIII